MTVWKKTDNLEFLDEVSSVPLQQSLRHPQSAYAAFFAKRSRYPSFKSKRKSRASAEYTRSGFKYRDGRLTPAKQAEPLDIVRENQACPCGAVHDRDVNAAKNILAAGLADR